MNGAVPPATQKPGTGRAVDYLRPPRSRRRFLWGSVASVLLAIVVVLVVTGPFGAGRPAAAGATNNTFPTSLQRIAERALSQQTQVNGTLGYAGDSTIRVPAGTAPGAVAQARGSVSATGRRLASARASLAGDDTALADARGALSADQQRIAIDCAGNGAAQSASTSSAQAGAGNTASSSGSACLSDAQLLSGDRQAQTQATATVTAAQEQVSSAERSLAGARAALASAAALQTVYGQHSVFTALPSPGMVVGRGQQLYAIDGRPVLLLYGSAVGRRAFVAGMSPGADVTELNANLDVLGYGSGLSGDAFTAGTAAAIGALQRARGMAVTGVLPLGSVVFEPGPVRVTSVAPNTGVGSTVAAGPLLGVSSTRRVISIALDTSLEGQVKVGDPVIITLPDNTTTPGHVSFISKVARSSQNGTSVEVHVVPSDARATGTLDQAPVSVQITIASVAHALVVPVNSLVALAGGGYAVEEVSHGAHHLVAVRTGLFDDADGLVQIRGAGLAAGQQVVIPGGA